MTSPISRYRRELGVAGALVVLLALLAVMAPAFFRAANLRDLLVANAPVLVAAVGMTLVILARQIDISIGSQFAICGVAAGLLAKTGLPMPLVTAGVVATGAVLGAINGALVAGLGLPAIVVTLATMVVLREGLRAGPSMPPAPIRRPRASSASTRAAWCSRPSCSWAGSPAWPRCSPPSSSSTSRPARAPGSR